MSRNYHTNSPEYPEQREVYHDWRKCPAGGEIRYKHLEWGTDGRRLCDDCRKRTDK